MLRYGTKKIFLNTKGKNDEEVSEELAGFLHYIEDSTDVMANAVKSERVKCIHERVRKLKLNEEIGVKYMQAWEEKYYERQEGREEGRIEGIAEGRVEGIAEGKLTALVNQVCKKIDKGFTVSEIADLLKEKEDVIQKICDIAARYAPEYNTECIVEELLKAAKYGDK